MCRACRLLPHGPYPLIPAVLASMGWLAALMQDGCDFVKLTGDAVLQITGKEAYPFLEIGFDGYRTPSFDSAEVEWTSGSGPCIAFDEAVQDNYWTASKIFQFLAIVLGGGGALFLWFSTCFVFSKATWRWAGYEVFFACMFQGLSFLYLQSDLCQTNTCSLFKGAKLDIAAAAIWFTAFLLICCKYPLPKPKDEAPVPQTVTEPQVVIHDMVPVTTTITAMELPVEGDANVVLPCHDADSGAGRFEGSKHPEGEIS